MNPPGHPPCAAWFGSEPVAISRLGRGGFSGTGVWLVERAGGERWVLKRFPAAFDAARVAWIHGLMAHLRRAGSDAVPRVLPLPGSAAGRGCGSVWAAADGGLWELVEFLPGHPRSSPSLAEATAALATLAQIHAAAARLPGPPPAIEPSPGVARRAAQAARLLAEPWHTLLRRTAGLAATAALEPRLLAAVEAFAACEGTRSVATIAAVGPVPVPVQPVIRDLWSEHVLFDVAGAVRGIIDFHAAGRDTPATDLARLLGSWDSVAAGEASVCRRWGEPLAAYDATFALSRGGFRLIDWLHASAVILGLDNWFRWLFVEGRAFPEPDRIPARLDRLLAELPAALAATREARPDRD